jgi:ribosomal protein S6
MRSYQLTLIVRSTLKDSDRKKAVEAIKSSLEKAKFLKEEEWGQKPLSYPIKKEVSGFFLNFHFDSEEGIPSGFEKKLLTDDNVLRHLLLSRSASKGEEKAVKKTAKTKKNGKKS